MALRHLWIVWVALLSVSCRSGNRASPEWPPVLMSRCRRTQSRNIYSGSSVCRWKPSPTPHGRTAWTSTPGPCRWTLVGDDRWTGCSLRGLPLASRPLARLLEPMRDWREAMWWMAIRIAAVWRRSTVLWVLQPIVRSTHQLRALQNKKKLNFFLKIQKKFKLTKTRSRSVVHRWLLTSCCAR